MEDYPIVIDFSAIDGMSDEQFFQFCVDNNTLRFERNADGTIILMSPESPISGRINSQINFLLYGWNLIHDLGTVFGPDTGFILPDNAMRSPDASWISHGWFGSVRREQLERFPRICPEFVIEVVSPTDSTKSTHRKMEQWIAGGALLGWMIVPKSRSVTIFRKGQEPELISGFDTELSGEQVLPEFKLDLRKLPI